MKCKGCGKEISSSAQQCPYCEYDINSNNKSVSSFSLSEYNKQIFSAESWARSLFVLLFTLGVVVFALSLSALIAEYNSYDRDFLSLIFKFLLTFVGIDIMRFSAELIFAEFKTRLAKNNNKNN